LHLTRFRYHPEIINTFPSLVGGIILAKNIQSPREPDTLNDAYVQEQTATIDRIGDTLLSQIVSLAAWRQAFRAFDVDPTQYRSAAEALLRRLTKKGDIPSINPLVDIGNLVSIRYAVPIAVLDTRLITGAITVHFADGTEEFTPLGRDEVEYPGVGEVIFSDENKRVAARRWCWRQSDQSAARAETTEAIITVEAHHEDALDDVQKALNDLVELLETHCRAECSTAILGKGQLSM
jgi:DNA/RNA-binding domain of Phe-tRNA-synthetase-like protein